MELKTLREQVNSFLVQLNTYFDFFFVTTKEKEKMHTFLNPSPYHNKNTGQK